MGAERANRYEDHIFETLERLRDEPHLGASRPDIMDGCRSIPVETHTIYYIVGDDDLAVVQILHQRQNPAGTFGEPASITSIPGETIIFRPLLECSKGVFPMIAKLPKQTEEHIQHLIETGELADSEAVLVQAVDELTQRHAKLGRLRALIQEGIDSIEQGHVREWTPELRQELWEEAKRRHAAGEKPSPDVCP